MRLIETKEVPVIALRPWDKAASLFPRYSEAQIGELVQFRKEHGDDSVLPLVVSPDFRIVDGYNRWASAKAGGIEMIGASIYAYADDAEMEIHAIVLNAKRRHLDAVFAARAAARLEELYRPKAEETKAKLSEAKKGNQNASKEKNNATTPVVKLNRPERSLEKASKEIGVSPSTVRAVKKIDATGDGDLIGAMEKKEISIERAAKLADTPQETRKAALEAVKSEAKASLDKMGQVCEKLREEGAMHYVAGCVDANIRLNEGRKRTHVDKLDGEQLKTCFSALAGVASVIKEMKDELETMIERRGRQ